MSRFKACFYNAHEQPTPIPATVKGNLPTWLQGSFIRHAPGKFDLSDDFCMKHWVDGYTILYKFDIDDGKVHYQSKYVQSDVYKSALKTGKPIAAEFGTEVYHDPSKNAFSKAFSNINYNFTDNCNMSIWKIHDCVFLSAGRKVIRVNPDNLDTLEKIDWKKIINNTVIAGYLKPDEEGDYYTATFSVLPLPKYNLIKVSNNKNQNGVKALKSAQNIGSVMTSSPTSVSIFQSVTLSKNYATFTEQPFAFNMLTTVAALVKGSSLHQCFEWRPQQKNRFVVFDKRSGNALPTKYKTEKSFFEFAHVNSYEENGQLIVDLIGADFPEKCDEFYLKNLRSDEQCKITAPTKLLRFTLPLPEKNQVFPEGVNLVNGCKGSARAERLGDTIYLTPQVLGQEGGCEFSIINSVFSTIKHRFVYAVGSFGNASFTNSILKMDMENEGPALTWSQDEYTLPSEPSFLARPGATEEDDGVLLSCITDPRNDRPSFLLVLDARSMTEVARAEVPVLVPLGMHGVFLPRSPA